MAINNLLQNTLHTITSNWINFTLAVIFIGSIGRSLYLLIYNKLPSSCKNILILSLSMLCIFYVLNCHEYIKSGIWYRIFWAQPLSIMITFLLIDVACQSIPKMARRIIFLLLGFLALFCWWSIIGHVNAQKTKSHFLAAPRAGIYISNSPEWIATVEKTTEFLEENLKPNELFLALPYDCLYYYLTGKRAPTRQLIFFDYMKISRDQEESVIAQLEKNRVNYILLSNRAYSRQEPGLGFLGTSYCPLIGKYINSNFTPIARFGDWKNEPGWACNHGTLILKRKVMM